MCLNRDWGGARLGRGETGREPASREMLLEKLRKSGVWKNTVSTTSWSTVVATPYIGMARGKNGRRIACVQNNTFKTLP